MGDVTLTQKEQSRLQVLNGVLGREVKVDEATEVLGLSERHVWRILAAYRREGAAALAHGNRGRQPANTLLGDNANPAHPQHSFPPASARLPVDYRTPKSGSIPERRMAQFPTTASG